MDARVASSGARSCGTRRTEHSDTADAAEAADAARAAWSPGDRYIAMMVPYVSQLLSWKFRGGWVRRVGRVAAKEVIGPNPKAQSRRVGA